jgi:bifunctional non-homologous end joining protein LigD
MPTARVSHLPAATDPLQRYAAKRDFKITPEPGAKRTRTGKTLRFVIQKHWASHLHYDFRLEHGGVLLSWAVPKGPSFDPKTKRMAVHVEDHPVSYGGFEGTIPARQYGAGEVIVWDHGTWEPEGSVSAGLRQGKLVFRLHGEKLAGLWELVRISKPEEKRDNWLLFKKRDEWARAQEDYDVTVALPDSVVQQPLGLLEGREAPGHPDASTQAKPGSQARRSGERAKAEPRSDDQADQADREADKAPDHPAATAPVKAPRAPLPETLQPQLATLAKAMPASGDWIHEFKFDGYRLLARVSRGKVKLFTRKGHDWTAKMPAIVQDIEALGVQSAWLDGEVIALGENGLPNFNALQNAFDASHTSQLIWYLFDAPYFEGRDLREVPLRQRRELLAELMRGRELPHVRFSEALSGEAAELRKSACSSGLEGLMVKRADSPYVHARSDDWLKIKCSQRQEFIVLGYTERTGGGHDFGSLLLGYHDETEALQYAGNVGTGWDSRTREDLYKRMKALEVDKPPAGIEKPERGRWSVRTLGVPHWLKPKLVVEVSFAEWTPDGRIRHSSFQGLRVDKPASEITREKAMAVQAITDTTSTTGTRKRAASTKTASAVASGKPGGQGTEVKRSADGAAVTAGVRITHADRVIDASSGLTKLDLARYYESVAEHMLPHLKARPVSLVRAPDGVGGEQFFQKHADKRMIPDVRELDAALWPGHEALTEIPSALALIQATQMNVIELHTWNATTRHLEKPDRLIFDLDPGEGVTWPQVREAAMLTRTLLDELGLQSWLKTSGGKGLHVVVPIAVRLGWQPVKDFSRAVVEHLARTIPSRFVAKSGPKNRVGRIFADYLRNGEGQTTVAAFSARARPGLGVSMPIAWEQLPDLKSSDHWTIATARDYLSFVKTDPWADYWQCRQTLTPAIKRLGTQAKAEA